jgi:hypothetical protein
MTDRCDKCNKDSTGGSWLIEGDIYRFCKICTGIIALLPMTHVIPTFLGENAKGNASRNIKRAVRMRREGHRLWGNQTKEQCDSPDNMNLNELGDDVKNNPGLTPGSIL